MAKRELKHLKAAASRTDYPSMGRFAAALYEHGCTDREVIRRCYGVEFPDEFFLFARADDDAEEVELVDGGCLVWELASPSTRGGLRMQANPVWRAELQAFAIDPGLIPLTDLPNEGRYGSCLICYHTEELAAGRSTVFGLRDRSYGHGVVPEFGPDTRPERYGPSLLAVLHENESDKLRGVQEEAADPRNYTGFGAITSDQVEEQRHWVQLVEDLQRRLATLE
ncbi:hypothetical protein ACWGI8_13290 [Streptomyces sp. NPDC054841]